MAILAALGVSELAAIRLAYGNLIERAIARLQSAWPDMPAALAAISDIRTDWLRVVGIGSESAANASSEAIRLASDSLPSALAVGGFSLSTGLTERQLRAKRREYDLRSEVVDGVLRRASATFASNLGNEVTKTLISAPKSAQIHEMVRSSMNPVREMSEVAVVSEAVSAFNSTLIEGYRIQVSVPGWAWRARLDSKTCGMCWAMHGRWFPLETPFYSHPRCRCLAIPAMEQSLIDTGPIWFADLSDEEQLEILGRGRYDLYKSGRVTLADMVMEREHPLWGPIRDLRPVSQLQSLSLSRSRSSSSATVS